MPKISIIVPVYNVESYICRCIDSILGQSCQDFEVILIDDGSPDNCGRICDMYAQEDNRIHVIHRSNGGLSAARNSGIDWVFSQSDSQWLAFVDSDDWIHRDYLRLLLAGAEQYDAGVSMCDYLRTASVCEDVPVFEETIHCMDAQDAYVMHYGMCMTACCKLYRKELFTDVRFPVGKLHEDAYVTHIPLFGTGKVAVCTVPMYYYYENPTSITRIKWSDKRLQEVEAHELRLSWLKRKKYSDAYRQEMWEYVRTLYEHAQVLALMCQENSAYIPFLKQIRKKLHIALTYARKMGLYAFEREYLWLYLMSYGSVSVWNFLWNLRAWLRNQ